MTHVRFWLLALCGLLCLLRPGGALAQDDEAEAAPQSPPPPEVAQPAYDVFRLEEGGIARAYRVWEEWVPQIVTTPDGGAWTFFTAQAKLEDGYGDRRLFAARFDPDLKIWLPAQAMGSGGTQFGASAVIDSDGIVHLVYSALASDRGDAWSQLVYTRFQDGAWTEATPIAPDANAGHQMLASLAIDHADGLHVVWRDQRFVSAEAREALPSNADLLTSDLVDGAWTEPVQLNERVAPDVNPAWPNLVVDGDRLVAIWSIYRGTTEDEMKSAARVEWSTRPLDLSSGWSKPQTLFERQGGDAGGRLIDLTADPRGGAVVIFGLYNRSNNDLYLQRLEPEGDAWSDPILVSSGDYGYLPVATVARDGTIFAVFNNGRNRDVDIGGLVTDAAGVGAGAVSLTPAEPAVSARASITLDQDGVPWVVYMHQPLGSSNVTEIRSVRAAAFAPPPGA
jgi:hypothetical protein